MITLGRIPEQLVVNLTPGAPFFVVLHRKDPAGQPADWPSAPILTFEDGPTWTASVSGSEATWDRSSTEVDAVIDGLTNGRVRLALDGHAWATGSVVVNP